MHDLAWSTNITRTTTWKVVQVVLFLWLCIALFYLAPVFSSSGSDVVLQGRTRLSHKTSTVSQLCSDG